MLYYSACIPAEKNQFDKCLGYTWWRFIDWFFNMCQRGKNLQKLSPGTEVLMGTIFLTLFQPRWLYACKSQFWNSLLASSTCPIPSLNRSILHNPPSPPKRLLSCHNWAGGPFQNQCSPKANLAPGTGELTPHTSMPIVAITKPLSSLF